MDCDVLSPAKGSRLSPFAVSATTTRVPSASIGTPRVENSSSDSASSLVRAYPRTYRQQAS
ncbi:MAG: hypothetical protein VYD18_13335, partial [Candidatus Latescibacterota bacterium]|nr:hypothetical protein [Candidatus Latescibacterota bacterium]